jgi:peptide/nickel transport system permease protein
VTRPSPIDGRTAAGLALVALIVLAALIGPALTGYDPRDVRLDQRLLPPLSAGHLLGSDQLGRDMAARLLAGLRWSTAIAGLATVLSLTIGVTLGLVAARAPIPLLRGAINQVTALTQSFPVFVLAVSIVAVVGASGGSIALTLGLATWPVFCRVVQAEAQSLLQREYVLAAAMTQMSPLRLYAYHVLPGLAPSLAILVAVHFADMLIAESALSFLGLGAPLGAATWGAMLSESRSYLLTAPWLLLAPAAAVVVVVIALNLVGDTLRRRFA